MPGLNVSLARLSVVSKRLPSARSNVNDTLVPTSPKMSRRTARRCRVRSVESKRLSATSFSYAASAGSPAMRASVMPGRTPAHHASDSGFTEITASLPSTGMKPKPSEIDSSRLRSSTRLGDSTRVCESRSSPVMRSSTSQNASSSFAASARGW
jgi:hypothetical protein